MADHSYAICRLLRKSRYNGEENLIGRARMSSEKPAVRHDGRTHAGKELAI